MIKIEQDFRSFFSVIIPKKAYHFKYHTLRED